jgi:queuine tRNA-ribosyltransferase
MEIQRLLGSDIVMAFDECTPFSATRDAGRFVDGAIDALGQAVARWVRCGEEHASVSALFGIQQINGGGSSPGVRATSSWNRF